MVFAKLECLQMDITIIVFFSSSWIMIFPKSTGVQFDARGIHKLKIREVVIVNMG
jgi:hypothetical protein